MGLRGLENGVTRFHEVRVPAGEPDRRGGPGPEDRPHHPEHRPALPPRQLRGGRQGGAQDRAGMVGRTGPVGPADRRARGGRQEDRVHRRHRVRARGRSSSCPASSPTTSAGTSGSRPRWPSCTARRWPGGRGRAGADPRRPGLRDRRVAGRARRARGARRADAARHADQPDLRGILGDHAPVHRPGGGGRAPRGGRRGDRARRCRRAPGPRGGPGRRVLRHAGCPRW